MSVQPVSLLAPVMFEQFHESGVAAAVAIIGGIRVVPVRFSISHNAHGATDTGSIDLPISNGPDWPTQLERSDELGNADSPVYCDIYAGFVKPPYGSSTADLSQLTRRFTGVVDLFNGDFRNNSVSFQLRSLAAPLTSDKITVPFQNQTTVAFVQAMATKYGLQANIELADTPYTVQQVLADEFIAGTHNMVIWDLMLQCATWDDVDIWVDRNGVLNYRAPYLITRTPLDLKYGRDLANCLPTFSPQFSKNVQVEVRSYQKVTKQSHSYSTTTGLDGAGIIVDGGSRTVTSSPVFGTNSTVSTSISDTGRESTTETTKTGGAVNSGFAKPIKESGKEKYIFYIKNIGPQQAADLSKKLWRQISQHEAHVKIELPVTSAKLSAMDVTALVRLHGTPWARVNTSQATYLAQLAHADNASSPISSGQGGYWPREIDENFDPKGGGWHWSVDMLNHVLPQGAV